MAIDSRVTFTFSPPPIVVDASAAIEMLSGSLSWGDAFRDWAVNGRSRLVPINFFSETANGLMRGSPRFAAAAASSAVERLIDYGIEIADRGPAGLTDAMALAERHNLTVYDALYLQLAMDVDGELATLDRQLRAAAQAEEVPLLL